jgi:hypothetical protein
MSEPEEILTNHALLVAWGQYGQASGFVRSLEAVPLSQKSVLHRPQTKVIEFLVAILGGFEYLKDISLSAHPLDQDLAVAQAWGQPAWADHSGVSRTLHALCENEVRQLIRVTEQFCQPFIDKEVTLAVASGGRIELDGDHSPRPVSDTSTTYPGAAYGHMDQDQVGFGYQAEIVSLCSPTYGRIGLSVIQRPGNTISCTQALALVEAAERRLGCRPWRRTDLLRQRIQEMQPQREHWREKAELAQCAAQEIQAALEASQHQLQVAQQILKVRQATYQQQAKPERPNSQLAKVRHQEQGYQKRIVRLGKKLTQSQGSLAHWQENFRQWEQAIAQLEKRLERFEADNQANSMPLWAVFRLDSGFGTAENIALLIEMGYEVYSKPYSNWLSAWLREQTAGKCPWQRVGENAEMVAWPAVKLNDFPYRLDLGIERFWVGQTSKLTGMLHFGVDPVTQDLPGWFHYYNARQTIEAANRESKQVFEVHHLKVRAQPALQLQEQFTLFAANFVRFASVWLAEQCPQVPDGWKESTRPQVKQQVKIGANTSAYVTWKGQDCLLRFTLHSVFAGRSLHVQRVWAYQPVLPMMKSCFFSQI